MVEVGGPQPQRCYSVFVASRGIALACDQSEAYSVERFLLEHDAPAWAIAAVLREMADKKGWAIVEGVSCDTLVVNEWGSRKDAPGTPTMWDCLISAFSRPLVQEERISLTGMVLGARVVAYILACAQRIRT